MDITNKLDELTQEILSFAEVIDFAENPADSDFRNACELFSSHLMYQLSIINSNVRFQDIRPEMQQTTSKLFQLSELISPHSFDQKDKQSDSTDHYQWPEKLMDFCNQLETLKHAAA